MPHLHWKKESRSFWLWFNAKHNSLTVKRQGKVSIKHALNCTIAAKEPRRLFPVEENDFDSEESHYSDDSSEDDDAIENDDDDAIAIDDDDDDTMEDEDLGPKRKLGNRLVLLTKKKTWWENGMVSFTNRSAVACYLLEKSFDVFYMMKKGQSIL